MMIFISCAKTMAQTCLHTVPYVSEPEYLPYAEELVKKMAALSEDELADALKVSPRIAAENKMRYTDIMHGEAEMMPAVFAYTGVVFKHMAPQSFSAADLAYAQDHLRITSFLYGLLRPLDAISPYRLEGGMEPDPGSGKSIFNHWHHFCPGPQHLQQICLCQGAGIGALPVMISIFREPAAIVPLAYHLPFAAGLNQFGKPAAKQFLRRLHPLDIVNPHPLIERME